MSGITYKEPRRASGGGSSFGHLMARRAMYGGGGTAGLGRGIESLGGSLGSGIAAMIAQMRQNQAANSQMQQYNTINPPRATLVGVPGESVDQFAQNNPTIPTQQSTIPAPVGQGALGMQDWMAMQNHMRAEDTAKQEAVMRGMHLAQGQENFNYNQQAHPMDLALKQAQIDKYQQLQTKQPQIPSSATSDLRNLAIANGLAKQYTGLTLDDVTKNPQDWKPDKDGNYHNEVLSRYYNRDITIPSNIFADQKYGSNVANWMFNQKQILDRYRQDPKIGPLIDHQLNLSRAGQPNASEPQGETPANLNPSHTPGYLGPEAQDPALQHHNQPGAQASPLPGPTGATPVVPNAQSTGSNPPVAGSQGKQMSPADAYIMKALGGTPQDQSQGTSGGW